MNSCYRGVVELLIRTLADKGSCSVVKSIMVYLEYMETLLV